MSTIHRWLRRLPAHLDTLVLLVLAIVITHPLFQFSKAPFHNTQINYLDDSWALDLVFKAQQHLWSGRDFTFTYGPLWQALYASPTWLFGFSFGTVSKWSYLCQYWSCYGLLFLFARLLLGDQQAWRRAVYLLGLAVFWMPADVRLAYALAAFAVGVWAGSAIRPALASQLWQTSALSLLSVAGFLLSADCGLLASSGLAVAIGSRFICSADRRDRLRTLLQFFALCLLWGGVWVLVVNSVVSRPLDFRFWEASILLIQNYRWNAAQGIGWPETVRWGSTIGVCAAIFLLGWTLRRFSTMTVCLQTSFFMAACVFSVLALQKGLVRSGWGHLTISLFPSIALAGAVLFSFRAEDDEPVWTHVPMWSAVLLTLLASGPCPLSLFGPANIWERIKWREPAQIGCPDDLKYFDGLCLSIADFGKLNAVSSYLTRSTTNAESIMVFPYENIYGAAARRRVAGGVLQSYLVAGEPLTRQHLRALESERPSLAIYSLDDLVSWPMDGVASFTRSPEVWSYLVSNFGLEKEVQPGLLVLRRLSDDAPRPHFRVRDYPIPAMSAKTSKGSSLAIRSLLISGTEVDFLRVRLRIVYPWYWRFLKPSQMRLAITFSDGTGKDFPFVVEPNRAAEIWLHPWETGSFREYFVRGSKLVDMRQSRPILKGITLVPTRLDWASVHPSLLEIQKVEGVLVAGIHAASDGLRSIP